MSGNRKTREELQLIYDQLVATIPEIQQKGKNNPYTSINGNMFSFLAKEDYIAIRLPQKELEVFLEQYNAQRAISYGSVMKEYAEVPDDLLGDVETLSNYLKNSLAYARTLKAKPTKKKK